MCGIGGYFLKKRQVKSVPEVLQIFSAAMRHRGPDDEGYVLFDDDLQTTAFGGADTSADWFSQSERHQLLSTSTLASWRGGFVHRRLSILDLSVRGHQPYLGKRSGILTYNGEIYNYRNLIPGFQPKSDSDTEVLVEFLENEGLEQLSALDGMFAFGWYSKANQQLSLVRDRMGVKPLYYLDTHNFFAFSSEPAVLHRLLQQNPQPNPSLILDYLVRGIVAYEGPGFWEPVQELPPGYRLTYSIKHGQYQLSRWFNPDTLPTITPVEARRKLKAALSESVNARLRSDVPLGCSLSGGLDSGLVTALAKNRLEHQPLYAFTATWPGQPENEAVLAQKIAQFTGAEWIEIPLEMHQLESYWAEITRIQGLPLIHMSTMAQGKVMQTAAHYGVKVMLDGQGGDELFGGYYHHSANYLQNFNYLIKSILESFIRSIYPAWRYSKHPLSECWNGSLPAGLSLSTYRQAPSLTELLKQEAYGQPLKNLFRWADRSGMAYSIESRFPLADSIQLQEVAFSLSPSDLIGEGWTKLALRIAAEGILPVEVIWNKEKSAYASPQHQWVRASYQNWLEDLHPGIADFLDVELLRKQAVGILASGKSDSLFRIKALSEWLKLFTA